MVENLSVVGEGLVEVLSSLFFKAAIRLFNEVLIAANADANDANVLVSSTEQDWTVESLIVEARELMLADFLMLLAIDWKLSINVMKSAHDIVDLKSLFVEELILSVTSSIESTISWSFLIFFLIWDCVNLAVDPAGFKDVIVDKFGVLKLSKLFVIKGEEEDERPM